VTRAIPQAAINLVKDQEETHLFVYDDAFYPPKECVPADQIIGTLTAGTGHTDHLTVGMTVTQQMADDWLTQDLDNAGNRIQARIGSITDQLTDNQYSALLDFVFNVGANPSWTIWKRLSAKPTQFDQVPLELQKFVNIRTNGAIVKSADLIRRRNAEIALWSIDEPGTTNVVLPSSVTRQIETTPPTPIDPKPASKSKALVASAAAATVGAVPMIDQIRHAILPYAEDSQYVHIALGVLATAAAACAGLGIFFIWVQTRDSHN
jgi:GH24 family phage-related lysozyme (muramidase)